MENFIVSLGNWKWLCIKILVDNFATGWLENSWFLNYLSSFWVAEIMQHDWSILQITSDVLIMLIATNIKIKAGLQVGGW